MIESVKKVVVLLSALLIFTLIAGSAGAEWKPAPVSDDKENIVPSHIYFEFPKPTDRYNKYVYVTLIWNKKPSPEKGVSAADIEIRVDKNLYNVSCTYGWSREITKKCNGVYTNLPLKTSRYAPSGISFDQPDGDVDDFAFIFDPSKIQAGKKYYLKFYVKSDGSEAGKVKAIEIEKKKGLTGLDRTGYLPLENLNAPCSGTWTRDSNTVTGSC